MKEIIFLFRFFILLICQALPCLASDRTLSIVGVYNQSKVNFELETNSPYYSGDESQIDSSINIGALLETPIAGQWGFESGLVFLQRGYQLENRFDSSKQTYRWKSLYIPFVGRFHPTPLFTGSIGIYYDQSIGDLASFSSSDSNSITYQTMKEHGYQKYDYGMTYSAGVNLKVSPSTVFLIEIRFNESWSNLMDTNLPNVDKREKATISETQLFLGFII